MKTDSKLSSILHVLLHMAYSEQALTSEQLAAFLHTNPVVVRRTLANLRELGYVSSVKGHGGGWTLTCDLNKVTLRDIYNAVGAPSILALGNRTENPICLVEQAVNRALNEAFQEAENLVVNRLNKVSLADLIVDFKDHVATYQHQHQQSNQHEH